MATSGLVTCNYTCGDLIKSAMQSIGALGGGETPSAGDYEDCLRKLNFLIQGWKAKGVGLWLRREAALFLGKNQKSYKIGPTGDHCTLSFSKGTTSAAAASGASTITVTDDYTLVDLDGICTSQSAASATVLTLNGALVAGGIATLPREMEVVIYSTADDSSLTFVLTGTDHKGATQTENVTGGNAAVARSTYQYKTVTSITTSGATTGSVTVGILPLYLGIELDSGALEWETPTSETAGVITISGTLSGAASSGNTIYLYDDKINRPESILEARYIDGDTETPIHIGTLADYQGHTDKTTTGTIQDMYYSPETICGTLYTWPVCNNVDDYIKLTVKVPLEKFNAITDEADFPEYWYRTIELNLAIDISRMFGKPVDKYERMEAQQALLDARLYDSPQTDIKFTLDEGVYH